MLIITYIIYVIDDVISVNIFDVLPFELFGEYYHDNDKRLMF